MGVVLDTSILVAAERRKFDLPAFMEARSKDQISIAAITASELLHGYERTTDAGLRARRANFIERLLERMPVLPFTLATAQHHARAWADLTRRGIPIGPHDLIVAATALEAGYAVATLNRREFERVPGLALAEVDGFAGE